MSDECTQPIRLHSRDGSVPTTASPASLLQQYPGIAHADLTPRKASFSEGQSALQYEHKETQTANASDSAPETKKGRNLVVCIDGTANQFGLKNTHVVELYSRLVADETQLTYYDSGIGTYVAESNPVVRAVQWFENALDMALAIHHKRITLSAYQWLSENYIPGDQIYLFGFSRGAYQVRIIAGMIQVVGLLRKCNNNQIQFAYQLYLAMMKADPDGEAGAGHVGDVEKQNEPRVERARKGEGEQPPTPADKQPRQQRGKTAKSKDTPKLCSQFKRTLCHKNVVVHFVGVWDTVSSIGATRGAGFPETVNGMLHVRAFRHALSLHERRIKFLPEYGNGGGGPRAGGDVKEVWFAGSHSDIGGGNADNLDLERFGPPLRWMLYEALDHGLRLEPYQGGWSGPEHHPSMTPVWRIFEAYPWKRLAYDGRSPTAVKRWPPHFAGGRRLQPGQRIHESAIEFLRDEKALKETKVKMFRGGCWVRIQRLDDLLEEFPIEQDSHSKVIDDTVKELKSASNTHSPLPDALVHTLHELINSPAGRQSLIDRLHNADSANILLDALQRAHHLATSTSGPSKDRAMSIVIALCAVLAGFSSRPEGCTARPSLYSWLRLTTAATRARIMETFGPITGHVDWVCSVAYSPDGKIIASGSEDFTIRLWDVATEQLIGAPLRGHSTWVLSVAFSPDRTRIVSGSHDNTIRIWDVETHQAVGTPMTGHQDDVRSVTFSPDGKTIASGSDDTTIRIWDADTGRAVGRPLRGHTGRVWSVAFSPDGRRIASGSSDETVRIWDTDTRREVRVLRGHSNAVFSVVFSPDGARVVSGSSDKTVRVWNAETGNPALRPLRGRTDCVNAVAVSPDGKYIASGSTDCMVRLWDAQSGQALGGPLRGHTRSVLSVAFSPDSRCIASGSGDGSLMIWEVA